MDLTEVKKFFTDNREDKDVAAFIAELSPLTIDRVKAFVESDETGKQFLNSHTDQKITKAIETYKTKTLPELVAAETEKIRKELNPKETEEQKQIRLINEKLTGVESERKKEKLKNLAILQLTKNKLPAELAEKFLGEDEAGTTANINALTEHFNNTLRTAVEEKFKAIGRNPKGGEKGGEQFYTPEQISAMSPDEVLANLDKVNQSLAH